MRIGYWMLPAGIFLPALLPSLPQLTWLLPVAVIGLLLLCFRNSRWLAFLVLGFTYGCLWGQWRLEQLLPVALDKIDLSVTGTISSLPEVDGDRTRFEFIAEQVDVSQSTVQANSFFSRQTNRKLLLSWYGAPELKLGERWRMQLRLRAPRGFANPAGFDYEGWLFAQHIVASGYVRAPVHQSDNQRLATANGFAIGQLRQFLLDRLQEQAFSPEVKGYMAALVLGETGFISAGDFRRLVDSGTVHLMVVSGLHVGMVAGLCFAIGLLAGRVAAACGSTVPAKTIAGATAMAGALLYGALAGFGLPVQRALIMTLAALCALLVRRRTNPADIFAWALCGVALAQPLAVINQGFWLSFGAVAGLMYWFAPRTERSKIRSLLVAQPVVFLALAPLLLFFQGQTNPLAIIVNLVVIPWVSLLVVPLCLLGAVFQLVAALEISLPSQLGSLIGDGCWRLAAWQLELFGQLLTALEAMRGDLIQLQPDFMRSQDIWLALCGCLIAVIWLSATGLRLKMSALIVAVAVLVSRPQPPPFLQLTVFDVGQGLAAVVRAGDKTLVYDTGPAFSARFNTGSAVVAPYLASIGVDSVDALVVSHQDNDHAGGVAGLLDEVSAAAIYSGQPVAEVGRASPIPQQRCQSGMTWRWHSVDFRFLWPVDNGGKRNDNNSSCVLLVTAGAISILLPGDIEQQIEQQLLATDYPLLSARLSLLVAAHHGSKTSSSPAFVAHTSPEHVLFSSGFNHHFGHPHPQVVARFQQQGSQLWRTSDSGAISYTWDDQGRLDIAEQRQASRRYWRQPAP